MGNKKPLIVGVKRLKLCSYCIFFKKIDSFAVYGFSSPLSLISACQNQTPPKSRTRNNSSYPRPETDLYYHQHSTNATG